VRGWPVSSTRTMRNGFILGSKQLLALIGVV
jgi:hypothetical protein